MKLMTRFGSLVWLFWLIVCVFGGFALFESLAFQEPEGLTFSRFIYNAWHAWPVLGPLMGIGIGILLSHFFWEWSPKLQAAEKRITQLEAENAKLRDQVKGLS
jgi:hypothetical protein